MVLEPTDDGLREDAAALQLLFLLMLQQLAAHQPSDGGGGCLMPTTFVRLLISWSSCSGGCSRPYPSAPSEGVGTPVRPLLLPHPPARLSKLLILLLGDPQLVGAHLIGGRDHDTAFIEVATILAGLEHVAGQAAQGVHSAALPGAALEHSLDLYRQPQVGV